MFLGYLCSCLHSSKKYNVCLLQPRYSNMFDLLNNEDFRKFVLDNNLISYSISWIVAITSTLLIQSAVGDILLPTVYFSTVFLFSKIGAETNPVFSAVFEKVNKINVANFFKELISFFVVVLLLYFLTREVMTKWMGKQYVNDGSNTVGSNTTSPSSHVLMDVSANATTATDIPNQQPLFNQVSGNVFTPSFSSWTSS